MPWDLLVMGMGPLMSALVRDLPRPALLACEELLANPLSMVFLPLLGACSTEMLLMVLFLDEAMVLALLFDLEKDLKKLPSDPV